ncbi:unnamed protein product (macronuclear) [Paramecium tetraurelia]|uniref:MORN repeat-containing protein 3 n=1 Tax=Paramecium tetraurelia TaxID=5888 RepID=A0CZ77_PARTE|nr:uncharacterized protein GSPATT00011667001 [Paramecium tetraurelia]CAK76094.1 unnamed protein product [Paramecium tetraurelia]|eukprot:XP_001443491.1 hypothetical protein (macronuclear) [Paramecium tetraurelia strain d4-2]
MKTDNTKCFGCSKKEVEYLQIEDIQSSYALCEGCLKDKKENKSKYLKKDEFLKKYEEKLKKEFPHYSKVIQYRQNIEKLKFWEKQMKPHLEDALLFIKNNNYTQQNFYFLGTFFQKKGKTMDKLANQLLNFLNANKLDISNPIQFMEQNKNDKFKEIFLNYLQEIIQKQQFSDVKKFIEAEIDSKLSKIPKEFQKVGTELKCDSNEKEQSKYQGYINLFDLKNGKGILKKKDIIYYGIFDCDIFIYGVKFEQISQNEGQFFFGQFVREEIQGFGKMLAYKLDFQMMYQEYEGNFENGLRHGKGQFMWKQNNKILIYEGGWQKNLQHGEGNISNQNSIKNVQYEEGKLKQDQPVQKNGFQMGFQTQFQIVDQSQALIGQKMPPPQFGSFTINQPKNQFNYINPAPAPSVGGFTLNKSTQPDSLKVEKRVVAPLQTQLVQQPQNQRLATALITPSNGFNSYKQTTQVMDSNRFQISNFSNVTQTQKQQISGESLQTIPQFSQQSTFKLQTLQTQQPSLNPQNINNPLQFQSDSYRMQTQLAQFNVNTQAMKNADVATFKQNNVGLQSRQNMSFQ